MKIVIFKISTPTLVALGSPILMDPNLNHQQVQVCNK